MQMLLAATPKNERPAGAVALEMACPRCRAVQPAAPECGYCGVVVHKVSRCAKSAGAKAATMAPPARKTGAVRSKANRAPWPHRLADAIMGFVVNVAIALILEWGLLHLVRAMWSIYIFTPVGHTYLAMNGPHAATLQYLTHADPLAVAVLVTLAAVVVSLASGIVSQLLHLRRLFHEPFGWVANLCIWVPPLTAATGWLVNREDDLIRLGVAYVLAFWPTLLLFNRGLYLAKAAVPEAASLLRAAVRGV